MWQWDDVWINIGGIYVKHTYMQKKFKDCT